MKPKFYTILFLFISPLTFLFSLNAEAQLFQITNRNYGSVPDAFKAEVDTLFDGMEDTINSGLPDADPTTYLSGIAGSSVISGLGVGTDFGSSFKMFMVSGSVGAGFDLGGKSSASGGIQTIGGLGAQVGIGLGVAGSAFGKGGPITRFKFFGHYFKYSGSFEVANIGVSAFGLHAQYKLVPEKSFAMKALKWGGVDLTSGFRYMSMDFLLTQSFTISQDQTLTMPGNPVVTAAYNGVAELGADVNIYSIPIQISSSARLLYLFNFYGGLGADISFGSAKGIAEAPGGVTVTDSSGSLGTITADAGLDLGANASPKALTFHSFGGVQLELGVLALYLQGNKSLSNDAIGFAAGLKGFW